MALISCTVPPTTPRRYAAHPSPFASPSTPRFANEIRSRFQMQTSVTLTISAFCSLLTKLNASYADDGEYLGSGGRVTEQTRLERIESFREDYMLGALTTVRPPPALLANDDSETFSDGTRRSSGDFTSSGASDLTSSPTPLPHRPRYVPPNAVERGILAEKTIKADLMRRGALLVHADFESLPRIAQKARRKTVRSGKPVYVSPGLITSPSWASEYFANGWARPGLRWSSFKPDLIRFEAIKTKVDEEPCVTFEVVEIKYRAPGARETIFSSWKVQAVYYHLALSKVLSASPGLVPSHRACIWVSEKPSTAVYSEKPLAIRTSLAFVEHHLFKLLPGWLHAVTAEEWEIYETRREKLRLEQAQAALTPSLVMPDASFLDRLQGTSPTKAMQTALGSTLMSRFLASSTASPSSLKTLNSPFPRDMSSLPPLPKDDSELDFLPPLPEQTDEELSELTAALAL